MLIHALLAVSLAASGGDSLVSADSALKLMKKGGYTMIWRHAETDWTTQDAPGSNDRALQRNLTARGEADATAIGMAFKHMGIPVGDVYASQMWRARETAEHAFGKAKVDTLLRTLDQSPSQMALLAAVPAKGTNRVLVTHHFVIEKNVPGIRPGQVGEGEAVIVRPVSGNIQLVSVVKLADWEKLTHGAVVAERAVGPAASPATAAESRPALHGALQLISGGMSSLSLIHDARYSNVLRYMEAYNSGEESMKNFLEKRTAPDSARPLDQRLEGYRQLYKQLGALMLDGAELRGEDFVLQTRRAVSKDDVVQLTFQFESTEPYRMRKLTFTYMKKEQ
ncbi:MAG TPA: histidine phosphatase family protein [Gemmatimonadaceae bacterium]